MKKIAIVAALAALSASAFAQSSVTLYGRVNTTVESEKAGTGARTIKVNNNASRIGFKGLEDLGGGLKASFDLEHGFDSSTGGATGGTANFWNREASVQLAGDFGAVRLGRWTHGSHFAIADDIDFINHNTGNASDALEAYVGGNNGNSNKVAYFTPMIDGFQGQASVSAGENQGPRVVDLSGTYGQGPLHVGFGYTKADAHKQFGVSTWYEMGQFTLGAYLQRETLGTSRTIARLSAMYTEGAGEFHASLGGAQAGAAHANGAKQLTLGYNHNLSKRTKVYGFYTMTDSKDNNQDLSSLGAGIRHNF